MSNTTYKEKGTNYRAMVIDLARLYQQQVTGSPSLIRDVLIATHEGALDTDTSRFTVDLHPAEFMFTNADNGNEIMLAWVHKGNLADELHAGVGVELDNTIESNKDNLVDHTKIVSVVEALGDFHHVGRAIVQLTKDRNTEVAIRDFAEVTVFTVTRGSKTVSVGFFKG